MNQEAEIQGGEAGLADNMENNIVEVHPLLINRVLLTIFSFFKNDTENLGSFRQVCTDWEDAADVEFKKCAVWVIGSWLPTKTFEEYKEEEECFISLVCNSRSDIFGNFGIVRRDDSSKTRKMEPGRIQRISEAFLTIICPIIKRLEVSHSGSDLLAYHEYLKVLTKLEDFTIEFDFEPASGDGNQAEVVPLTGVHFEKLKRFHMTLYGFEGTDYQQLTAICQAMLDNSPHIQDVAFMDADTIINCRHSSLPNLRRLELCHKIVPEPALLAIMDKCPNLRKFDAKVSQVEDEGAIRKFVNQFASQLECLKLCGHKEEELDVNVTAIFTWPACPQLTHLELIVWQLHNNFNFQAPSLHTVSLTLRPSSLPLIIPIQPLVSVKQLTIYSDDNQGYRQNFRVAHIDLFIAIFPNVVHLETSVKGDDVLAIIIAKLPCLKELRLGSSPITDVGITGLSAAQLKKMVKAPYTRAVNGVVIADVSGRRRLPWIGNLADLKLFSCYSALLTEASVYYAFINLKQPCELELLNRGLRRYQKLTGSFHQPESDSDCDGGESE